MAKLPNHSDSGCLYLSVFNPDKTIIGIGGISIEKGLTDHRMDETLLTRNCLKAAGVTIGLADHSKFGTVTSYTIGPARMIQYLITSDLTPETVCEPYIREGVRVPGEVAPVETLHPEAVEVEYVQGYAPLAHALDKSGGGGLVVVRGEGRDSHSPKVQAGGSAGRPVRPV